MKAKASTVINKRVAASVKASMDFEGLRPSAYAQKIGERYLEGEISSQDALAKIRAKHASKFGR
ncbi:MAG: antitoxin VbhA family protein [Eubacteriales bacterium]|nr:antitoxin VbhA family protein [Eubacteriales bacterium]